METKVAIIISTYNRVELLKRTLTSLSKSFDKIKPEIIMIHDDYSKDRTGDLLQKFKKENEDLNIQWYLAAQNLGLRHALDFLLRMAYEGNPDYICYVQDDVEFEKGWLDKCVNLWESFDTLTFTDDFPKKETVVKFGFITGHDAPEHPVKMETDVMKELKGVLIKDSCRATHLFASTKRWKEFGEIPELTPGIAAPKPGQGSMVDWWLMGHPEGKFPESKASLKQKGEKVLCIPGLIKHIGNDESTWGCYNFERQNLKSNRVGIQLITRNRPEYLGMLLTSLRNQTIQNWDLFIVDNSDTPVADTFYIKSLLTRLQWEGHRVQIVRHPERDIGLLRNIALDLDDCEFGCRIDDDSICESDYLERLLNVLKKEKKAGCVGGIVPFLHDEKQYRPLPKRFNILTKWYDLKDDSIWFYNTDKEYIPADHIRSTMMYRNEIAKKIRHPEAFGRTGFREETVFSYRFILHGYNNYYVPKAVCWHFAAPSGGGRDEQDFFNTTFNNDQKMKEVLDNEIRSRK